MEPSDRWQAIFLLFGAIIPVALIAADIAWLGANVVLILAGLIWFGFLLFVVEGVKD